MKLRVRQRSFLEAARKESAPRPGGRPGGYLIVEALVYIGAVFVLLGAGYVAMFRCIENSTALRRNVDDITSALHAGERWRADVRGAAVAGEARVSEPGETFSLGGKTEINYRFSDGSLLRQVGEGPWVRLLNNVQASTMLVEERHGVQVCRWELELKVRARTGRVKPLFTFMAASENKNLK